MKKVLMILLASIAIISCNSPQKKAEKLAKVYVKENANDPSSYKSVSFEKLKSYEEICQYSISLMDRSMYHFKEALYYSGYDSIIAYRHKELHDNYTESIDSLNRKYKFHGIDGWYLEHWYQIKNEKGDLMLNGIMFYFNHDISEIIDTNEL